MAYSTLTSVSTGDIISSSGWGNVVRSNFEDHETRISAVASVPQNYISGLEISNGSDADHDIDIAVGQADDDANAKYLTLASSFTKQIDATFAKGTNQGGLDTGTVANSTFYYFWIIEQDSTGDIDILISASQTSPTMPSGWTAKRRIRGAVLTDGSANILGFRQKNENFRFDVLIQEINGAIGATTQQTLAISCPPGFRADIIFTVYLNASGYFVIQESTDIDAAPSVSNFNLSVNSAAAQGNGREDVLTNSSSQIFYRTTNSAMTLTLLTRSFIDNAQ